MLRQESKYELRKIAALFPNMIEDMAIECYLSLITLKYISQKGIGLSDVADYEKYRRVSDYFGNIKNTEYPADAISSIISSLVQKFGDDLYVLLIRFSENVANLFVNNIDLTVLPGWELASLKDNEKNKELENIVQAVNILSAMYYSRRTLSAASYTLYNLAKSLLNVTVEDSFVDYVAGSGISTFAITDGKAKEYKLYDIRKKSSISLLSILFDVEDLSIEERNLSSKQIDVAVADKIFMDPPLGFAFIDSDFQCDGVATRDLSGICILRASQALKDEGMAVITSTAPYLAGSQKQIQSVREYIIKNYMLKAVISLPGSWYGSNINTNLIILSKDRNNEVIFIDASKFKIDTESESYVDATGNDITSKIVDIINGKLVTDMSNVVAYDNLNVGNIAPIAYIKPVEGSTVSIDEINTELQTLYSKIGNILQDLSVL